MIDSSEWVLKAILNRTPESQRKALLRCLGPSLKQRLDAMPTPSVEIDSEEPPLLDQVHWSWILPLIENSPAREQKLLLTALSASTRKHICEELKIKAPLPSSFSKIAHEFASQILTQRLVGDPVQLLPAYLLPSSPLSGFLKLPKLELVSSIDTLSFPDLAAELRQIVETKILKKIYSFLSDEEKTALKKAAQSRSTTLSAPLSLKKWDGTEKSLRLILHRRGLVRLGAALSTQHPDFVWYLSRRLDIGRGKILEKLSQSPSGHQAGEAALAQIEAQFPSEFS